MYKNIYINEKYQKPIENIENENIVIETICQNTFNKFINEDNTNTKEYVLNTIIGNYFFVPNDTRISEGRYIRYLDMKKPLQIKFRLGGFVVADNGYSISFRCNNNSFYKVSKTNNIFFCKFNKTDLINDLIQKLE